VPPLFQFLQEQGNVEDMEMLHTFNMGQGFLFVIPADQIDRLQETIGLAGQQCYFVGKIIQGDGKVHYTGKLNYADTSH
jgi:phosphoribosylformylglycinamidine cyclo-ligase